MENIQIKKKKAIICAFAILIIIIVSIIIFSMFKTKKSENFDEFRADFLEYNALVQEVFINKKQSYSLKNEPKNSAQISYEIATGVEVSNIDGNKGKISSLGTILPGAFLGKEFYQVDPKNEVLNWNKDSLFYEKNEKYYITDKGETFFLPGYLVKENREQRWYISDTKYYIGEKKSFIDLTNKTQEYDEIGIEEEKRLNTFGVKILNNDEVSMVGNENLKNPNIKMVLKADSDKGVVPVPVGFEYVTGTEQTGLVIESNKNQFVWVPVPDPTILYDENSEKPINLSGTHDITTKRWSKDILGGMTSLPGSIGTREPDLILTYDSNLANLKQAGMESAEELASDLVNIYNEMIDSIIKYKGFYVGRYELGYDLGVVCKQYATSLTAAESSSYDMENDPYYGGFQGWYGLYNACKGFSTDVVTSSMIWGCQWDAMCIFLGDSIADVEGVLADGKHNLTGAYNDHIKNINDTRTGLREWTMQANYTDNRNCRGGDFKEVLSTSAQSSVAADFSSNIFGTRVQLYIK